MHEEQTMDHEQTPSGGPSGPTPSPPDTLSVYRSTSAPGLDTSTVGFDDAVGPDDASDRPVPPAPDR